MRLEIRELVQEVGHPLDSLMEVSQEKGQTDKILVLQILFFEKFCCVFFKCTCLVSNELHLKKEDSPFMLWASFISWRRTSLGAFARTAGQNSSSQVFLPGRPHTLAEFRVQMDQAVKKGHFVLFLALGLLHPFFQLHLFADVFEDYHKAHNTSAVQDSLELEPGKLERISPFPASKKSSTLPRGLRRFTVEKSRLWLNIKVIKSLMLSKTSVITRGKGFSPETPCEVFKAYDFFQGAGIIGTNVSLDI
jgi:hypothetical protein